MRDEKPNRSTNPGRDDTRWTESSGSQRGLNPQNRGQRDVDYDRDRSSDYSDFSDNFSGRSSSQDLRHEELQSQYQPNLEWNKSGRESGFGQANPRDQSYGQQYGRPYAGYPSSSYYSSGADQGSYGQDSQRRNFGSSESQHSIYGPAGFGSLGNGPGGIESPRTSPTSYSSFTPSYSSSDTESGKQTPASYYGKGPKGYKRSDERIKEDISEVLTRHPGVDASDIEIDVRDGEVFLSGTVVERRMKFLAEDLSAKSMGVKDVINNIRLRKEESSPLRESMSPESDRKLQPSDVSNGKKDTVIPSKH
jgi:osmotically-inducible protein OsmY